jgi:hypothetical protein
MTYRRSYGVGSPLPIGTVTTVVPAVRSGG